MEQTKYRQFRDDDFWKNIPGWEKVTESEFGDHGWQARNSIRNVNQIRQILGHLAQENFIHDLEDGLKKAPMNIRITPYVFSLINWENPVDDPLRKQFLPLGSQFLPDHPFYLDDSLSEDVDSPVAHLTHRYPDKVLFLALTICPVYCAYCTRSRLIGGSTLTKEKDTYAPNTKEWEAIFDYISKTDAVEDVIISGGDVASLPAKYIEYIGEKLLAIPHVRRIRYATKALAVYPQKFITDVPWMTAFLKIHKKGRESGRHVCIHTHFSSPKEITRWTQVAMDRLFSEGVIVRNQSVLQTGVNDSFDEMALLVKQLSWLNIRPYYVFQHDMVPGCEHLRTTLTQARELEKEVRGITAGFNMPNFVCDLPGGGGKRHVASYEYYNQETGISVWKAPHVKPGKYFTYFDPIHQLPESGKKLWADSRKWNSLVEDAKVAAGIC